MWIAILILISILTPFSELNELDNNALKLNLFDKPLPIIIVKRGLIWVSYFFWILNLLFILAIPVPLLELLNKRRISLILSKPISRYDLINKSLIAFFIVSLVYSVTTMLLIAISFYLKYNIVPLAFILSTLTLPFSLLGVYIIIVFFVLTTNSYGLTVLLVLLYKIVISPVLESFEKILSLFDINNQIIVIIGKVLYYLLPQVDKLNGVSLQIYQSILPSYGSSLSIILSFIPVLSVIYIIINRKEF